MIVHVVDKFEVDRISTFFRYALGQTDRQTDRQTDGPDYNYAPPLWRARVTTPSTPAVNQYER